MFGGALILVGQVHRRLSTPASINHHSVQPDAARLSWYSHVSSTVSLRSGIITWMFTSKFTLGSHISKLHAQVTFKMSTNSSISLSTSIQRFCDHIKIMYGDNTVRASTRDRWAELRSGGVLRLAPNEVKTDETDRLVGCRYEGEHKQKKG